MSAKRTLLLSCSLACSVALFGCAAEMQPPPNGQEPSAESPHKRPATWEVEVSAAPDPQPDPGADAGEAPDGGAPDGAVAPGTAVLTWTAPTTNEDGTPLTDLAGYYVYHSTETPISAINASRTDVGNVTTYTFTSLPPGTHYFAVTTYNTAGTESIFSGEASKVIP